MFSSTVLQERFQKTYSDNVRSAVSLPLAILLTVACSGSSSPVQSPSPSTTTTTAPPAAQPIRVLMLTATAGFRHDAIPTALAAVAAVARAGGIVVTATENLADVNATRLGVTDVPDVDIRTN